MSINFGTYEDHCLEEHIDIVSFFLILRGRCHGQTLVNYISDMSSIDYLDRKITLYKVHNYLEFQKVISSKTGFKRNIFAPYNIFRSYFNVIRRSQKLNVFIIFQKRRT